MKTLLILRHAKSSWKKHALDDHDRPLNKRGKRDAPRMGRLLKDEGLTPDLIIASTAERARKTAQAVAKASGCLEPIRLEPALYHAGLGSFDSILSALSDVYRRVAVVGHNPGLEVLLNELTDHPEVLPTCALAQVTLPVETWSELDGNTRGELVNVWLPRELS